MFFNAFAHKLPGEDDAKLHWDELKMMLREWGRALMFFTSRSPYAELAGPYGLEPDTADAVPVFFEKLLTEPQFVHGLTRNVTTGERMKMEDVERTCRGGP